MPASSVAAIVWGETRGLAPVSGSVADLARLDAVVASLMAAAQRRGQLTRYRAADPPQVGTPDAAAWTAMATTVDQVASGGWTGAALPPRAVLWEVTNAGVPVVDATGSLPAAVAWITGPDAAHSADFTADGRSWRLFESAKVLDGTDLPFISSRSGSGSALATAKGPSRETLIGWGLGAFAALVFVVAGVLSVAAGRSLTTAHGLLITDSPALQSRLINAIAATCRADDVVFAKRGSYTPPAAAICSAPKLPTRPGPTATAAQALHTASPAVAAPPPPAVGAKPPPFGGWMVKADALQRAAACAVQKPTGADCNLIWRSALQVTATQSVGDGAVAWANRAAIWIDGSGVQAGRVSLVVQLDLMMVAIALLVVSVGVSNVGRWDGVWICQRNRVSLARAQVTLWTIVALGGYAVIALFNVGTGLSSETLGCFPQIPGSIAAALGIAVASPMLSAVILRRKAQGQTDDLANAGTVQDRGAMFRIGATSGLDARPTPADASIEDIFMGEEAATSSTIDPSRLQNVVITVMLVMGYAALLLEAVRAVGQNVFGQDGPFFAKLPDPGPTFAALLFASHATYLVAKQFTNTPAAPATGGQAPTRG